jgi:hypothetical protein
MLVTKIMTTKIFQARFTFMVSQMRYCSFLIDPAIFKFAAKDALIHHRFFFFLVFTTKKKMTKNIFSSKKKKKMDIFFSPKNIEKRKQALAQNDHKNEAQCHQALIREIPKIIQAFEDGDNIYYLPYVCQDVKKDQKTRVFEKVFGIGKRFTTQTYKNDSFEVDRDFNFLRFSK